MATLQLMTGEYWPRPTVETNKEAAHNWLVIQIDGVRLSLFASASQCAIIADAFARAFPDPEIAALDPAGDHFPERPDAEIIVQPAGSYTPEPDFIAGVIARNPILSPSIEAMDTARRAYPAFGEEPRFEPFLTAEEQAERAAEKRILLGVDLASAPDETAYAVVDAGTVRLATADEIASLNIPEGFTPWTGGPCPVDGEVRVSVRLGKDDWIHTPTPAGTLRWEHEMNGIGGDITAYRVIETPAEPDITRPASLGDWSF